MAAPSIDIAQRAPINTPLSPTNADVLGVH